jgi:hypothetical protein
MISISVYVPESHLNEVKAAMFAAGAGKIGNYDSCAWQTLGTGQYRPLEGSAPYHGQKGRLETLAEWKVEMVCEDAVVHSVIAAMKQAHPYETPAYLVFKTLDQ